MDDSGLFRRQGRWRLLAAIAIALVSSVSRADPKLKFELRSDVFPKAILDFYYQSKVEVLFLSNNTLYKIRTQPVSGELEPREALERMLRGTGLTFEFDTPHSVIIRQPDFPQEQEATETKAAPEIAQELSGVAARPITVVGSKVEPYLVPMAPGAEVVVVSRPDISVAGAQTVQEALRAIPQVWYGGPEEDTYVGTDALQNVDKASSVNIRGLDASATLVLLNGHRLAPSGTAGGWTDISSIPVSAIERIQLLPSSDSVALGGDAVAGIANFVVKSNFSGAETDLAYGHAGSGPMDEIRVAQLLGKKWDGGQAFLAVEYYRRSNLPAADRARATSDLIPWGGQNFDTPFGNPGTLIAGSQSYAIPKGQSGTALTLADLTPGENLYDPWRGSDLEPAQRHISALGTLRFDFDESASVSVDALANERVVHVIAQNYTSMLAIPPTNPFIPAGLSGPIFVEYGFQQDLGQQTWKAIARTGDLAATADVDLGHSWTFKGQVGAAFELQYQRVSNVPGVVALEAALADPDRATAFNPFGDGSHTSGATLSAIRGENFYNSSSQIDWFNASVNGNVCSLPGGDAAVTFGSEYRRQALSSHGEAVTGTPGITPDLGRHVNSVFAEATLPVLRNAPAMGSLAVSAGIRNDRYDDTGSIWSPQITTRWEPLSSLALKVGWGRSSKPPDLPDLQTRNDKSTIFLLPDSHSLTGTSKVLAVTGGNAGLRLESATSWTAGFEAKPTYLPGLSLGATYFNTRFADKVDKPNFTPQILNDPNFAYTVTRNPSVGSRDEICSTSTFVGGAPESCLNAPVDALVDVRLHNVATTWTSGVDFSIRYAIDGGLGHWNFGALGTYVTHYIKQQSPDTAPVDWINTQSNPLHFRGRAYAAWQYGPVGMVTTANYSGRYSDIASQPQRPVKAWTTVDFRLTYDPITEFGVALNVKNIGNTASPFLNNLTGIGYDPENGSLIGRVITLEAQFRW